VSGPFWRWRGASFQANIALCFQTSWARAWSPFDEIMCTCYLYIQQSGFVGRVENDVELFILGSVCWSLLRTNHFFACVATMDRHLPFRSTEYDSNIMWWVSNFFVLKITVISIHDIKYRLAARKLGTKMRIPVCSPCVFWHRQKHSSSIALHPRRLAVIRGKVSLLPLLETYGPANVYKI
jgi:hypothetical protein